MALQYTTLPHYFWEMMHLADGIIYFFCSHGESFIANLKPEGWNLKLSVYIIIDKVYHECQFTT